MGMYFNGRMLFQHMKSPESNPQNQERRKEKKKKKEGAFDLYCLIHISINNRFLKPRNLTTEIRMVMCFNSEVLYKCKIS